MVIVFSLVLLASPLLYEGGQVLAARWLSMAGKHHEARTPIIDALSEWSRTTNLEATYYFRRIFGEGVLHPSTAIPFAIAWAILMSVMFLRRVR